MKEKILVALKTKYKSFGFSEKALDGVAFYLSQTITEESEIETALNRVGGLLKAFQGELDRLRTENSSLRKHLEKVSACYSGTDTLKECKNDTGNLPVWAKQLSDSLIAMGERLGNLEKEIKQNAGQTASLNYVTHTECPFTFICNNNPGKRVIRKLINKHLKKEKNGNKKNYVLERVYN